MNGFGDDDDMSGGFGGIPNFGNFSSFKQAGNKSGSTNGMPNFGNFGNFGKQNAGMPNFNFSQQQRTNQQTKK